MALAWWHLSAVLARRRARAAAVVGALVALSASAAVAWPSGAGVGATGPLQLFRVWSVAEGVAAALMALWVAASPDGPEGATEADAARGHRWELGERESELSWEAWHGFGGLSPLAVTGGLALSGWMAGMGLAVLALPPGLFAATVSGAPFEAMVLALAVAATAAGAAWGVALLAGVPKGLRPTDALVILGGTLVPGLIATAGPGRAPGEDPTRLSPGAVHPWLCCGRWSGAAAGRLKSCWRPWRRRPASRSFSSPGGNGPTGASRRRWDLPFCPGPTGSLAPPPSPLRLVSGSVPPSSWPGERRAMEGRSDYCRTNASQTSGRWETGSGLPGTGVISLDAQLRRGLDPPER